MCRIAGCLSHHIDDTINANDVTAMRDTMIAGGPDDAGLWLDPKKRIGFGHRRLSIQDLSKAGHQPMATPDGRFIICYNGEIYNFLDIRQQYEERGIQFSSHCDTEVLLHAFAHEGLACLQRLHGMFAIAVWDTQEKHLTLARDRIGVKPLYYAQQGNLFFFGSELKAIMAHPRFKKDICRQALQLFLEYSYIPHPYAILKNTYKLGPGQWLKVNQNGYIQTGSWWNIIENRLTDFDWDNQTEVENELENRMSRSFERRMIADVPVGVFLSGGIDSSLLLALLKKRVNRPIKTFTIGFEEKEYNEAHYAKNVATALGSEHHELYLKAEQGLEIIDQLATIWDEPFGDNSAIATYLVSAFAAKHVKVVLSADGGDELFCGYPKYWLTMARVASMQKHSFLCRTLACLPNRLLESIGRHMLGNKLLKIKDLISIQSDTLNRDAFIYGQHTFTHYQLEKLLINGSITHDVLPQASLWNQSPSQDALSRMMEIDLFSYHTDDIHTKVDRASMAHSLEAREPFLDQEIVEFALGMPIKYKLPNLQPESSKFILRKLLGKHLDKRHIDRPKMGFGVPLDHWLNYQLKGLVDHHLSSKKILDDGLFNPHYINQIQQAFKQKPKQELNKIWNLLVFQMWKEQWL